MSPIALAQVLLLFFLKLFSIEYFNCYEPISLNILGEVFKVSVFFIRMFRGIFPVHYDKERDVDWPTDVDSRINHGINVGKERGFIHKGDFLVIITGWRQGKSSP